MLKDIKISNNNYLIKQLPKATGFFNKKLEVVYASDTWCDTFDIDKIDVLGKNIHELFDPVCPKWLQVLNDCLMGMINETSVERFVNNEKKEKWLEYSNIPWYDSKENIIGIIVQVEDVTEHVLNEIKLEKLEVLLKEKSEIAKVGSWEYDAIKDEITWCKMTRAIHEVDEDFLPTLENGVDFYKKGYSRNLISLAVDRAMKKGTPWSNKLQIVSAKGNEKWVIAAGKPIFKNNEFVGLIGTFQDISNQVVANIKTKESEHLLKTVIDNLPLNVFIKDKSLKKILVNKSECEYLGVDSPDELLGKSDFDLYDKETAQILEDEDLKIISTLKPVLGREQIIVKKDGSTTTFLTSKIPLKDENGIANGLVGISLDISNLKQKEEELRNLINVTSQQNKKLINFAHIVSHNLRSHTANFSMLLDFLVNEKDESEKKNIIKMLTDASDNLLETLENLNEVVAISTNVNLEKKPINLNEKITAVEKNLKAFLINHNAKIINTIADDVHLNVVPAYLDSILMNFITNAVKYKAPERNPIVRLSMVSKSEHTILSIADNGMGIDLKKYGHKLFGMYKTFHNNHDARGIGLYITKNQIEAMNGKVVACSEVGKGTTFNIYFNEKN